MADLGNILGGTKDVATGNSGGIMGGLNGILTSVAMIVSGILVLGFFIFIVYYFTYKKKNWNLNLEIKIPRSNGGFIDSEDGKGNYNESKGVCYVKRKGKKAIPMKPFDVKKYVQGKNTLTVIQVSPGEYIPVLPNSYSHLIDDETGEEASVLTLKGDLSKSKAWKNSFEREAKSAYSITSLLKEYLPYIGFGILIVMNFVGFTILSRGLK